MLVKIKIQSGEVVYYIIKELQHSWNAEYLRKSKDLLC